MTNEEKFVVFPAGTSLCAVPAASVAELILPQEVFSFPHTSREILGVILRRGKVIPLYDLAGLLKLPESAPAHYHLITLRRTAEANGLAAFPVSGECDLVSADVLAAKHPVPGVVGELTWDGRSYELLDLDELILSQPAQLQRTPETPAAGSTE
jgi:chemotaxis signal transduction protein